ncbi:hypothetical protein QAD02_004541, partial [Eretmocerus hayati]
MDEKVDPCNDFYGFACGKFLHEASLLDNDKKLDRMLGGSVDIETLNQQIRSIFEDEIQSNDLKAIKNIKNYYKICTNKTLVEEQGLEPLHNILREFGGWPVLYADKSIGSDVSWMDSVYKSRKLGYPLASFITLKIGIDPKNSTHRVLQLDQAYFVLSEKYLFRGEDVPLVKWYLSFMIDIAEMLGAPKERAEIEMREALQFEISLAKISHRKERGHNATELYKMTTVRELIREFPSIPWLDYINRLLASNVIVAEDEPVMVPVSPYIAGLEKLLKETSNRTLANYAIWRVVKRSIGYLNRQIRRIEGRYQSLFDDMYPDAVSGVPGLDDCVSLVLQYFGFAVGALYERLHLNKDLKERAREVTSNIRREFERVLLTVNWMDKDTKDAALEKARSMRQHIGYPDDLVQDLKIEEYYRNFSVDPESSFLHASLSILRSVQDENFWGLREPVGPNEWNYDLDPIDTSASYYGELNSMVLRAYSFQGEHLKPGIPNYVSYGTIGTIVGHEMMHAFHDLDSQFDEAGYITKLGTNNNTRAEFKERVRCLINQANNYTFTGDSMK